MFVTGKHIPRRAVLRGMGVTLGLPLLESMVPALTPLAKAAVTPKIPRFVGIFNPHGWAPDYWQMPVGPIAEYPFVLKPLEDWKEHVTVVSGLDSYTSMPPTGTAGGDHSRSAATFSGVAPKKTLSDDIHLGVTVDQVIARKYGQDNALPSIQLGIEDQSTMLTCGWGYSCAYVNSVSWSSPTKPLPHESNPQLVFERLFGDGSNAQERAERKQATVSILDAVTGEVAYLNKKLPNTDRNRLNEYLDDIREIERRLHNVAKSNAASPDVEGPFAIPESFEEHIKLMWDMQVLAFRADVTRVSTLMYAHDQTLRSYPESGVLVANHAASHHGAVPKRVEEWARINQFHIKCLPYFLEKLKATQDGDGSLLDHTMILWASNMGDSNLHSHTDVAHMVIGGAMGQHKGGKHIKASGSSANLLLTTLHMFDIDQPSIGDSNGVVSL